MPYPRRQRCEDSENYATFAGTITSKVFSPNTTRLAIPRARYSVSRWMPSLVRFSLLVPAGEIRAHICHTVMLSLVGLVIGVVGTGSARNLIALRIVNAT